MLKETDDLDILRMTYDSKITFEKHLCSVSWSASEGLVSWGSECSLTLKMIERVNTLSMIDWIDLVFHDRLLLGRCIQGFVLFDIKYCSHVWCLAQIHTIRLQLLDYVVSGNCFLNGGVFECDIAHCRSVAVLCMLYKIRCNLTYPLYGTLHVMYLQVRVTCSGLVTHRYTYAPPHSRISQYCRTFIPISVSL